MLGVLWRKCIFCGERMGQPGRICGRCRRTLPYTDDIIKRRSVPREVAAPLLYKGNVRSALLRFKFSRRTDYAVELGELLADEIERAFPGGFDAVTWIPISRLRQLTRGYDQSYLLAREAGKRMGFVPARLLKKIRHNRRQAELSGPEARRENVKDAYTATSQLSGMRILLIDDIYTTGATFEAAAGVLLAAGARSVAGAVVARR